MEKDINFYKYGNNFIAYKEHKSKRKTPTIIFHHGLMSDMEGRKALYIHEYCEKNDINFIRFDNLGHGKSSGKFNEQTIGNWVFGAKHLIDHIVSDDFILIGSSMGGWVSLALAKAYSTRLKGLLLLAPAPDFTEELIWNRMTKEEQAYLMRHGLIEFGPEGCKYPIAYSLIEEGRSHLIFLGQNLSLNCPVQIIQGRKDSEVPYKTALRLLEVIEAPRVDLTLLHDSQHNLSSENELEIIVQSLEKLIG
ncbi:MAG: hypothetical protein K0Q51_1058 [Rickettsiaceae bacterium]|jgi:pimeloyl-ACP methyl ester carboxylesterase|nr:hypothetical protein [Rickettsiaceae bacterium]